MPNGDAQKKVLLQFQQGKGFSKIFKIMTRIGQQQYRKVNNPHVTENG